MYLEARRKNLTNCLVGAIESRSSAGAQQARRVRALTSGDLGCKGSALISIVTSSQSAAHGATKRLHRCVLLFSLMATFKVYLQQGAIVRGRGEKERYGVACTHLQRQRPIPLERQPSYKAAAGPPARDTGAESATDGTGRRGRGNRCAHGAGLGGGGGGAPASRPMPAQACARRPHRAQAARAARIATYAAQITWAWPRGTTARAAASSCTPPPACRPRAPPNKNQTRG